MRRLFLGLAVMTCVLSAAAYFAGQAASQDKGGEKMPSPQEQQEMMKRWMEAATPGDKHKKLAAFIGKWNVTYRIWMGGSGAPPSESKGTTEFKWLLPDRFVSYEGTGSMMGMPVTSFGILGYDNFKHKYVTCGVDSMNTHMLMAYGDFDRTGTDLVTYGPMDEPTTGEHDKTVKYAYRFKGKDKFVLEVYDLVIHETDSKVVEMEYTRAK
ncbi:MAG: DUF1579 domain-containing protein [Planctomycetes bacterium]|nr:DUF1579 domain-containing protein [Planctomycetota bacterium]